MSAFRTIHEPPQPPRADFALWQLGFRPFYLLAGAFGALSTLLWGLQSGGWLPVPYLPGPLWHAHEMLFGFALPVIVGFLFTAGRNWTQRPTPTGLPLAVLALLWLAARVLVLSPWGWPSALVNAAFPLAAAIALAVPFVAAGNRRNYFFVGLLVLMSGATLAVHLHQLGVIDVPGWAGIQLALDVVLFILCVMGGRVIPMFTNNGVPGAGARKVPAIEKIALGAVLGLLAADLLHLPPLVVGVVSAVAAMAHLARWLLWHPWRTLRTPMVWVLQIAYAWIPLHLALRAFALAGYVPASAATHALTTGAVGGLVIGMMTRTSRGHTGRPLRADRFDIACYLLVAAAALVRVLGPLLAPAATLDALVGSASLWAAGFGLFTVRYWPVLTRARVDGLPG